VRPTVIAARLPARGLVTAAAILAMLAVYFLNGMVARADPDHSGGDYFMFAKAAAPGTTTRAANEPACDGSNDKQADISGSSNHIYGRVHSNADLAISGSGNVFHDTSSPNEEITYGVNEPGTCQLQAEAGNTYGNGAPLNISGSGDATSIQGPYQLGAKGWPLSLGDYLDANGETFATDVTQVLPGASCYPGTSLTGTTDVVIGPEHNNAVVCNGTGKINIGLSNLGSAIAPFRITMISHGSIDVGGSNNFLVPADSGHGVLAWTDQAYGSNATAIKIGGSSVNVPRRALLFSPRSGQDVSGSVNATLCIQMIGQGALKAGGSSAHFGPLAPGCGAPAEIVTDVHANLGTGQEHTSLGGGLSAVEVGTEIHDKAVLTSKTLPASNLTGTITANRYDNGACTGTPADTETFQPGTDFTVGTTVTLDDILPFTPAVGVYSYRVDYGGDSNQNLSTVGTCEGPVHVVDASVALTPDADANEVGQDHALTTTVTVQGGVIANVGASVTATKQSGPGNLDPATCNTSTAAPLNACDVTLKSTTVGTSVVSASASIPIDVNNDGLADITLSRGTGTTTQTGAASKTWVMVRISISPATDANEVGSNHELTITLEKATTEDANGPVWTGVAGQTLTAHLTNTSGASATFVPASADSCTSAADGSCKVTISSPTAGTTTVEGRWAGGTVEGATISSKATDPDASKTWVMVRISISPATDANEVGSNHELTITLEKATTEDANGPVWTGVAGQTLTAHLTNTSGASATFVPASADSCTSAADGSCKVTISSPTAGTTTVEGRWAGGTVEGATISSKATDPDASKTWVMVRISISPATDANEVGSNHELTITLEKATTEDANGPVWGPLSDKEVFANLVNSDGANAVFTDSDDDETSCDTNAIGQCTVTINSTKAGTTTVGASWSGTASEAEISEKKTDPDASKTWVAVRISIAPADEANEVGSNHVLTITLEKSVEDGKWTPLADESVTALLHNQGGATAAFVPSSADSCMTAADGTCTVTISSPTAGTTTIEATWDGGTIDGASVGEKSSDPDNASKTWVAVRIQIHPEHAVNDVGTNHVLTISMEFAVEHGVWQPLGGQTVNTSLNNTNGATSVYVPSGASSCTTDVSSGTCIVTITSNKGGTTTIEATWAGGTVEGATISSKATNPDATKVWREVGGVFLVIDEDSLDNGIRFNAGGGGIVPGGPNYFGTKDVNDDRSSKTQRAVLSYFENNVGKTITVMTGQTGDEGWFAPNCIPRKWLGVVSASHSTANQCLAGAERAQAIDNFLGANGGVVPSQDRLDKVPAVMPLRALGLNSLVGKEVCAVVYDSDLSINYNSSKFPFTDANMQGETLGVVAFSVNAVTTLDKFSSSTLPQVTLTINDAGNCRSLSLFNAPVPWSSSVPNDRKAEAPITSIGSNGYRQLETDPNKTQFY
jgi:hypothetical protein